MKWNIMDSVRPSSRGSNCLHAKPEDFIMIEKLVQDSTGLLRDLIRIPSFSKEENQTADVIERFLQQRGVRTFRKMNNIWAYNKFFDSSKPTILLNSHHDTVKPNTGYTPNPFSPDIADGKLYGLGSNDAGGCLVSLIASFLHFYPQEGLRYKCCIAATAEEEISGTNGLELVIPDLGPLDFAIVGEPTLMQLAVAERVLMVLDCTAHGKAGHAAREEGDNAINKALKDIEWFTSYRFPKESEEFGAIKMSVTVIYASSQHNVVPATCEFVVGSRISDSYRHEEVFHIIRQHVSCEVYLRSVRLKPSSLPKDHPVVQAALALGRSTNGSPTTSDQA